MDVCCHGRDSMHPFDDDDDDDDLNLDLSHLDGDDTVIIFDIPF
jgi:hypothetical protein